MIDRLDSTTSEEGNKQQWTIKGTKLLLQLYKERKEKFRDPKTKKRNLWTEIVNEMGKNVYKHLTEDILDRKLRNLKKTFRTIKDNNRKSSTGRGRITWEYYDIFEEIFSNDQTINVGRTISSLDSAATAIQSSSFAASTILSPTSTSNASSSAQIGPPILTPPVRTPSPASTRYVCHTQPTRISTPLAHMRTFKHISEFFDSTFEGDLFFEENITNSYSSSHSSSSHSSSSHFSSSSIAAEHSFSESESVLGSVSNSSECTTPSTRGQQRKITSRKETYDLRKKLLLMEQDRIEMMTELKKCINDNNKIQQERNDLLKKLLEKM